MAPKVSEPKNTKQDVLATTSIAVSNPEPAPKSSPKKVSPQKRVVSPSPKKVDIPTKPIVASPPKPAIQATGPHPKTFIERMREAKSVPKVQSPVRYPDLGDLKDIKFKNKEEDEKRKLLSASDNFVVDFFEINDLYRLNELSVVAILENDYNNLGLYCVALVKKNSEKDLPSSQEFLAVSSLNETVTHKPEILKELSQKYDIHGFVLREPGKSLQNQWMSSIVD